MTREELIAYDRWLTENKWGSSEIITPEQAADLYLAKHPLPPAEGAEQRIRVRNILQDFYRRGEYELEQAEEDIMRLFQPQPTAEGAEEILESIVESLGEPINIHNHIFEIRPYTVEHKTEWWIFHKEVGSGEPLAQWLQNFAALHAQRIAEGAKEKKVQLRHLTDEEIEEHGKEGGLRDGELQMFWEGATFYRRYAQLIAEKMVSERDDDVFDKMNCLIGYLERWLNNPQSNNPPAELRSVIDEAIEYLKTRDK